MKKPKSVSLYVTFGLSGVISFLLLTAWFQIQAVRWGYKSEAVRLRLDELQKTEVLVDARLQEALSLPRLDRLAKDKFGLKIPGPSQVVLLREPSIEGPL